VLSNELVARSVAETVAVGSKLDVCAASEITAEGIAEPSHAVLDGSGLVLADGPAHAARASDIAPTAARAAKPLDNFVM
jgi:hypothetical protein